MNRRAFTRMAGSAVPAFLLQTGWARHLRAIDLPKPNILWITVEDIGPHLGCYGAKDAVTPNLDAFAARSLRFDVCWSNAPVCAPARTALITGVYPTTLGAEHMRSLVALPGSMKMYPQLLREHGYYCTNNSKEDYNLKKPDGVWDESSPHAHWSKRPRAVPFFAVFNTEITHEGEIRKRPHEFRHDPATIRVPAYHPDVQEVREGWAQYHDQITEMDKEAGHRLREVEEAGLTEETIIFFFGDNGPGLARNKRCAYNSGLHVPLLVYVPQRYRHLAPSGYAPGGSTNAPVSFVDFAPTLISISGGEPPAWMHGIPFMGQHQRRREFVFGFRGRMDERYDMVRSVRDERYIYIRNYLPHLIHGQYLSYLFQTPLTVAWKRLHDEGALMLPQAAFWEAKPAEEFYDVQADPDEVDNLIDSPMHQESIGRLRSALREHLLATRDLGFLPESELHRRAADSTPFDVGRSDDTYDLPRILAMAEIASSMKWEHDGRIAEGMKDADAAVRYWAVVGMIVRGTAAVNGRLRDLETLLADASPSVAIAAARAIGEHGDEDERGEALETLKRFCSPVGNGPFVALEALNAIDALGARAIPLQNYVRQLPKTDPAAPDRVNTYVGRLVERITQ